MRAILEAIRLYFMPLKSVWFWLIVLAFTVFLFTNADAGYLWTD